MLLYIHFIYIWNVLENCINVQLVLNVCFGKSGGMIKSIRKNQNPLLENLLLS